MKLFATRTDAQRVSCNRYRARPAKCWLIRTCIRASRDHMDERRVIGSEVNAEIIAILQQCGPMFPREIADKLAILPRRAQHSLLELIRSGHVSRSGAIGKQRYQINPQGRLEL